MDAPRMRHMRDKVEQQLKPMVKMLRAGTLPHGHLLAGGVELVIAHCEWMFRVMDERSRKLCWYEFCLTPEVFLAMGIQPFLGETHPSMMALGTPEVCWDYVDTAEQRGIPPELCVLEKFLLGALVRDELPRADFIVTATAPCDSSRIGYQMFEQLSDVPVYRLDAPVDDSPEAHAYYASEIRKLITFLEAQTGTRFDGDRLREVCEESNRATDAVVEWLELRRARPWPRMLADYETRLRNLLEAAERYRVDGIVCERLKFCDLWGGEIEMLRRSLEQQSRVRLLALERDYLTSSGLGQLRTRAQAFLESLG